MPPIARMTANDTARLGTNPPSSPPRMARKTIRQYVKAPVKIPSTTCMTRSPMKFRRIREVYWLEAKASVTRVMENVTPTTVIIEPAIVDNIPRAPSALTPNRRGQRASHCPLQLESTSINATAKTMLNARITEGTNQKLARRLPRIRLILFMTPFKSASMGMLAGCRFPGPISRKFVMPVQIGLIIPSEQRFLCVFR